MRLAKCDDLELLHPLVCVCVCESISAIEKPASHKN